MSDGFITLFRRSRYSGLRAATTDDDPARQYQQERFAVAMIAFSLRHDATSRKHFLMRICDLPEQLAMTGDWQVSVEPQNWGDLVLKHERSSWLIVAEFKIFSKLKEHQDPSKQQFSLPAADGQCAGYGWEIRQICARENWNNQLYVTIQTRASWKMAADQSLRCQPKEWRDLISENTEDESDLEAEVCDCLGHFGISTFLTRKMQRMKLATDATKPMMLLAAVLGKFGVNFRLDLLRNAGLPSALGFNIQATDFPGIARLCQTEDPVGWFGYESDQPRGDRISVWLYCRDLAVHQIVKRKLGQQKDVQEDGANIGVFCKADNSKGDLEWFIEVLSTLNGKN